jgi:hypothetical protein
LPFRYRGSRRESAVAQLFSLGTKQPPMDMSVDFGGSEAADKVMRWHFERFLI